MAYNLLKRDREKPWLFRKSFFWTNYMLCLRFPLIVSRPLSSALRGVTMTRSREFSSATKRLALRRQNYRCASCGTRIFALDQAERDSHTYGEAAHAHHIKPFKFGGTNKLDNCVILCESCHYSAHEGGNYRYGTVEGKKDDFPHYDG